MDKCSSNTLGKVAILGMGKTGLSLARYLSSLPAERVESITLYGGAASHEGELADELRVLGVRLILGTDELDEDYDLIISSPGISELSDFSCSAAAHAKELIGEPEFVWRESPERWVAITGTNGKTTTTTLTTELLRAGGMEAEAVGNIGLSLAERIGERKADAWFVAELSSFQLAQSKYLHPRVAALLNITPDHLEWHGSFEAYAVAKEKVFAQLNEGDLAVVSNSDEHCKAITERLHTRGLRVCVVDAAASSEPTDALAAFVRDGLLIVRLEDGEHVLAGVTELALRGTHNIENALTAAAIALELGVVENKLREALINFKPLEHRIEPCGELGKVRFINDSKATNTDSVEKALTAFEPDKIILLLGGHDKGTDLSSLAKAAAQCVRVAICFGEAGPRIATALEDAGARFEQAEHLKDATLRALELAEEGDVILLSPACSSFDEFSSYVERGRVFKELVAKLIAGTPAEEL